MTDTSAPTSLCVDGAHALLWESVGAPRMALLFVPGNPGLCGYYAEYLAYLHVHLDRRVVILAKSSLGHDRPCARTDEAPPATGQKRVGGLDWPYYTLQDQIASHRRALAYLCARAPGVPIVIVGHSIGAYMALNLLGSNPIAEVQLFFPTISFMDRAPRTRRVRPVLAAPMLLLVWCLSCILSWLPLAWVQWIVCRATGQSARGAHITAELVRRPASLYLVLGMAIEEFRDVCEITADVRAAVHRSPVKLRVYWGQGDSVR